MTITEQTTATAHGASHDQAAARSEPAPPTTDAAGRRPTEHVTVAVVGTGFAGLGVAKALKRDGVEDFVLLERADEVGGTWRDNTYPGCACDVPSHLYSFSWAPNPEWSRTFSSQPEIYAYLRRVAADHGLQSHCRFGAQVESASWDEASQRWTIRTSGGDLTARFLVSGMGALSEPSVPRITGIDSFEGTIFHSARWDHDHDLTGERVAVIGTGASSIQLVPAIQPQVAALHLFQRTAPWIMPRPDRPVTELERAVYRRLPAAQRLMRGGIYLAREASVLLFNGSPRMARIADRQARRHLARQVKDPVLRAKLTPPYQIGCKRILISNDYFPALAQPNAEVVTEQVTEVRPHSVVTADGVEREVDTIILGTGFHITDQPVAGMVRGRDGRLLADHWREAGMSAYLGTSVAGFPNLFLIVGPNTGLGHTSMVYMIESQAAFVADTLRTLAATGDAVVDVRPAAQAAYNTDVQAQLDRTVWNTGGCVSWYLDAHGKNTTLWPGFTWRFRKRTRRFDPGAYDVEPARVPVDA